MTFYFIDQAIKRAYVMSQQEWSVVITERQNEAVNLLVESLKGNVALGAVQGPPGTGKTSVVELSSHQIMDSILNSSERILIVYVAPTNHLVVEAFTRVVYQLFRLGFNLSQILQMTRIYGSRIQPCSSKKGIEIEGKRIDCNHFKELTGIIDPEHVRLVFATEYQRIASKILKKPDEIRYVVDEASRTPYFRVFIGLARKIVKEPEAYYPQSLIVLGDPKQAITVQEELKTYRIPLLMRYVEDRLKRLGHDYYRKYYIRLNITFRLPAPTELPISYGFYDGDLRAYEDFKSRYSQYIEGYIGGQTFEIVRMKLSRMGIDIHNRLVQTVFNTLEEALSTKCPIVVFNTRAFPFGDTFESSRAKISYLSSLYLSTLLNLRGMAGQPLKVGVTAPYSDLVNSVSYGVMRKLGPAKMRSNIIATTVQSIIGGEADIIVTMLGKERTPSSWSIAYGYPTGYDALYETMYFREYQVLNVQLSRHRLLLTMVGDMRSLKNTAERLKVRRVYRESAQSISCVVKTVNSLAEQGAALIRRIQ